MIKHTIYTDGDSFVESFVEAHGMDDAGNRVVYAKGFNSHKHALEAVQVLADRLEQGVCTVYEAVELEGAV